MAAATTGATVTALAATLFLTIPQLLAMALTLWPNRIIYASDYLTIDDVTILTNAAAVEDE